MKLKYLVFPLPLSTLFLLGSVTAQSTPTNATSLPLGSCTADIPCSNGACCDSISGFCGFGPSYCTIVAAGGNCTSNCDALAECGPFAPPANLTCPLNVCCSQYGFCGTTSDFCDLPGCQSNCVQATGPSCGVDESTATQRRIGYYEGWAIGRSCMSYAPESISVETLTHVNYAFALISGSYQVIEMTAGDSALWTRTTALKSRNPTLRVFLSIGGWSFNDPPTSNIFSDLAASSEATDTFIASAVSVLKTYGFDGIDIDWEYPGAYDRGGGPTDTANYVTLMSKIKATFGPLGYGLTFTAPSSYWYLQHFDLPGLLKSADWVNIMTYDLHGVWDGIDPYIGYVIAAHTNLTEIISAFELYWNVGIDSSQMVMGMAFYGRSFTLDSSQCSEPGCGWSSGGAAGPCSDNSGTLMYAEIATILNGANGSSPVTPVLDEVAAVKWIVYDTNQWVSYDDADTFAIKMN